MADQTDLQVAVEQSGPGQEIIQAHRHAAIIADDLSTWTETLEMLEAQLIEAPDEDRAELSQQIAEVKVHREHIAAELERKSDRFAAVVRRGDEEVTFLQAEEERLRCRRKAVERAIEWLRDYMVHVIQEKRNGAPIRTASNLLYLGSSTSVVTPQPDKVPHQYITAEVRLPLSLWEALIGQTPATDTDFDEAARLRVHCEPSLSAIKKALKAGEEVPGADLQIKNHLVIR